MAQVGCPDRRIDGSALRAVRPPNLHITPVTDAISLRCERYRLSIVLASGHHRPCHSGNLVGECDGCDLGPAAALTMR
jgi:hypothetical protein